MNKRCSLTTTGLAVLAVVGTGLQGTAQAAPRVYLDGQPLATSVAPQTVNGRTLVPMRDIFEALGASVSWNNATRSITANRGNSQIWLEIGSRLASVNGQTVRLEQPPIVRSGSTLVPLRFVSEALGAKVHWDNARQLVSLTTANGTTGSGQSVAGVRTITVPSGAVVPVTLDQELSSATARAGQTFTTTVKSERVGDSEFPTGSKIRGVVTSVTRKTDSTPGAIDVSFRSVVLPDGTTYQMPGELISLDDDSVTRSSQGRLVAKAESGKDDNTKTVLIGAGAGFLLGKVLLKKNAVLSTALGALAGYLYGKRNDDDQKMTEVVVKPGTTLGVRVDRTVTYADRAGYIDQREPFLSLR